MEGFFSQALVLLAATLLLLPLFQRLGLGSILGYLAAGIAVGPLGLALVSGGTDVVRTMINRLTGVVQPVVDGIARIIGGAADVVPHGIARPLQIVLRLFRAGRQARSGDQGHTGDNCSAHDGSSLPLRRQPQAQQRR